MAGARRSGPLGLSGDDPTRPFGAPPGAGFSRSGPLGIGEYATAEGSAWDGHGDRLSGRELGLRLGARQYRVLPPGGAPRADEEIVGEKEARAVVAEAANLQRPHEGGSGDAFGTAAGLLAELRRSPGSFVLVRVRPQSPRSNLSPAVPALSPSPPPARKPAQIKEGWIEIEVLGQQREPREGDRYRLKLPDGRVLEGTIGNRGVISVHGIDPGNADLTVTNVDAAAWSA